MGRIICWCWLVLLVTGTSSALAQTTERFGPAANADVPGVVKLKQWQQQVVRTAAEEAASHPAQLSAGRVTLPAAEVAGVVELAGVPAATLPPWGPAAPVIDAHSDAIVWLTHQALELVAPAEFPEVVTQEIPLPAQPIPALAEIEIRQIPENVVIFPKGDVDWKPVIDPEVSTTVADVSDNELLAPLATANQALAQVEPSLAAPLPEVIPPLPSPAQPQVSPAPTGDAQRRLAILQHLERPLGTITLSAVDAFEGPPNQAAAAMADTPSALIPSGGWVNPPVNRYPVLFVHQPLYFEEINLERCGWGHGIFQPIFSSGAFLGHTALLPVNMLVDHPKELVPSPGDCLTCQRWTLHQLLWKLDEE